MAVCPAAAISVVPSAWLTPPTGMAPGLPSVTFVSGPAVLFAMSAPTAPAAAALFALLSKVHAPRRITAIFPVKSWPAKSPASQPGVASPGASATATSGAVMPPTGVCGLSSSLSAWYEVPPTVTWLATATSSVYWNSGVLTQEAGGGELARHVVDAGVVAGGVRGAVAAVAVGDPLERDQVAVGVSGVGLADEPVREPLRVGRCRRGGHGERRDERCGAEGGHGEATRAG